MRKKGFTLVELLAVIVILAIIALIAVPVFLGIINKTKKSSDKEGVNLYTDTVEKAIQKKQMGDPNFQPDKCTIKTDGNLECFSGTTSLGTIKVTMKGTKPTSGTIYIDEDDITYENIILNGKKYYEKIIATLVEDAEPSGLSIGDKYTYKVNKTDTFNFYVLSIEENTVTLIMDRNICEDGKAATEQNKCLVAWHESGGNSYGPDTAMTYLYNGTKNWSNVPDMIMNYQGIVTSNGVTTITGNPASNITTIGTSSQPLKARLPMKSEIEGIDGSNCTTNWGSCPVWLVDGLDDPTNDTFTLYANNNHLAGIYGYWTLESYTTSYYAVHAYYIRYTGNMSSEGTGDHYGIRPVITVSKSDLQ